MAIEIPALVGFTSKEFRLVYKQQLTAVSAGYIQTADRADPFWIAQYQTNPLRDDQYDAAIAFLDSLQGSRNSFLGYDPRRPMPRAYQTQPLGNNPLVQAGYPNLIIGEADYTSQGVALYRVAVGAVFTAGDYLSWLDVDNVWNLHRVKQTVVAASNGPVAVSVEPRPKPFFHAGPPSTDWMTGYAVRYRKACAEMKMIGNYKETDSVDSKPVLSWQATQFNNRSV